MESPHRRYNPLTDSWVLVSPHRSNRPWQGQVEKLMNEEKPTYDPTCYLCPNNHRVGDVKNPNYNDTFVFDNDFSAILNEKVEKVLPKNPFFKQKQERGICRVICFSPNHNLTIPEMEISEITKVIQVWMDEYKQLGANNFIQYVQIFENKGSIMGCSNPHPHGQIWAQEHIPDEPLKKQKAQLKYFKKHNRTLLQDYLQAELLENERILFENEHFVGLIPFWAVWPFEAMIVPRRPMSNIVAMNDAEKIALADAYKQLTVMYDNLFEVSFPYSSGIHQAPTDGKKHDEWHWHIVFYPPLLRSATVKKFMVGYEMLANPQRDITPEKAASILKALPKIHYK